ncbi:hypothetical protein TNCV_3064201, partial [Trichonephila clavipes]
AVSDGASSCRLPPAASCGAVTRFLAAKKKSAKEIHEELCQVYGEECMSSGMVRRWVRDFKNGRTDVHDGSPCRAAIGFRRNNCQSRSGNA